MTVHYTAYIYMYLNMIYVDSYSRCEQEQPTGNLT